MGHVRLPEEARASSIILNSQPSIPNTQHSSLSSNLSILKPEYHQVLTEEFRAELKIEKDKAKAERQSMSEQHREEIDAIEKQALKEREQLADYLRAVHQKVSYPSFLHTFVHTYIHTSICLPPFVFEYTRTNTDRWMDEVRSNPPDNGWS